MLKTHLNYQKGSREYLCNLNYGAIPSVITDKFNDNSVVIIKNEQFESMKNGWVPMRQVKFDSRGRGHLFAIDSIKINDNIDQHYNKLKFDYPVFVEDKSKNAQYPIRKEWSLASLPSSSSKDYFPIAMEKKNTNKGPVLPGPRFQTNKLFYLGIATVFSICIAVSIYIYRKSNA